MSIDKQIELLKNEKITSRKVDILGNLIMLLVEEKGDNAIIYPYMKLWFLYYLDTLHEKAYRYEVLKFTLVEAKINLLNGKEKLGFLRFVLRNLKDRHYEEFSKDYEEMYNKEELLYFKKKNKPKYILRLVTSNLLFLGIFFLISIVVFSLVLYFNQPRLINLISQYGENEYLSYFFNIISLIFNIQNLSEIKLFELVFLLFLKGYFFIFITYYLLREISKKVFNE